MTWKKADVVRLKSAGPSGPSGPNMTVMDVSDDGVRCWWFDKSKLHEEVFPAEVLIEAKAANLAINIQLGNTSRETWERHLAKLLSLPEGSPVREEMIDTIRRELGQAG